MSAIGDTLSTTRGASIDSLLEGKGPEGLIDEAAEILIEGHEEIDNITTFVYGTGHDEGYLPSLRDHLKEEADCPEDVEAHWDFISDNIDTEFLDPMAIEAHAVAYSAYREMSPSTVTYMEKQDVDPYSLATGIMTEAQKDEVKGVEDVEKYNAEWLDDDEFKDEMYG